MTGLRTVTCASLDCGVEYGVPEHIWQQAQWNKERSFKCPNGHSMFYPRGEQERLTARVQRLEADLAAATARAACLERTCRYWRGIAHRKPRAAK